MGWLDIGGEGSFSQGVKLCTIVCFRCRIACDWALTSPTSFLLASSYRASRDVKPLDTPPPWNNFSTNYAPQGVYILSGATHLRLSIYRTRVHFHNFRNIMYIKDPIIKSKENGPSTFSVLSKAKIWYHRVQKQLTFRLDLWICWTRYNHDVPAWNSFSSLVPLPPPHSPLPPRKTLKS